MSHADRNLLFGILAVQMIERHGFRTPSQVRSD
jgi:hypothetical protein